MPYYFPTTYQPYQMYQQPQYQPPAQQQPQTSIIWVSGEQEAQSYPVAPPEAVEKPISYDSDTDFGRLVDGRLPSEILPVIDELVSEALAAVNPRLHDAFLRRLAK